MAESRSVRRAPFAGFTLQARITAAALATSVCVLTLAAALFFFEQWSSDALEVRRAQTALAEVVASQAGSALSDPSKARALLGAFRKDQTVKRAYLLDMNGRQLAAYELRAPGADAERLAKTRAPIAAAGGARAGELVILAAPDHLARTLPRYFAVSAALFFAAAGAALFLGRLLAARLMQPVDRLSRFMEHVTEAGDLSARPPPAGDDEIGGLTRSFTALLVRLQTNDGALRRTLGELVEARDAAEAANVLKSHFLANVSHEIRTPLNGVLAMAEIMSLGELDDEQREHLEVIRGSGASLMTVLNDVLDISKIEAGELALELRAFEPGAAVEAAVAAFVAEGRAKGLEMAVEIAPGLSLRSGDETRLRQIVVNLMANAVKFTARGGVRVTVRDLIEDGVAVLAIDVADTGVGIAADVMPRLFHKFVQADSSTTRQFGGTGLGLAICRELAAMMGGRIWAQSTLGQGARFSVRLPLAQAAAAVEAEASPVARADATALASARVASAPSTLPAGRLRVLAAEDNAVNRQVLASVLSIFEAEFEIVENGRELVEAWSRSTPDVILMDVQMPVMDGIAASRAIREAERRTGRARTPIIAVTANAMQHQIGAYLVAGMDGLVSKPLEMARLREALSKAAPLRAAA